VLETDAIDILEESISINTRRESISAVLAYPFSSAPCGTALVAGPHPLMGGGLQNNVVRAVARGMAEHGFVSLRFAYGGDGPSTETMREFWCTGSAPDDPNRIDDANAALAYLTTVCHRPTVLIGYSFGASVLAPLLSNPSPASIVLIGPTLRQHSYSGIQDSTVPKLIISADNDFATPLDDTHAWFAAAASPKKLVVVDAGEHFYRGLEDRLVAEILQWL